MRPGLAQHFYRPSSNLREGPCQKGELHLARLFAIWESSTLVSRESWLGKVPKSAELTALQESYAGFVHQHSILVGRRMPQRVICVVQVGVDNIREHMAQHSAATEDFNRRKLSLASQVWLLSPVLC